MVPTVDDSQVDESPSIPGDIVDIYRVAHPVDWLISVEPPVEVTFFLREEGVLRLLTLTAKSWREASGGEEVVEGILK